MNKIKNPFLSRKRAITTFLSQKFMITRLSIALEDFLGSSIQRPARFWFLENSQEFFFIFTSRSRSRAVSISLSLLEKERRDFIYHFSPLKKSESYPYFTLFSREKRVKSGAGYNLTSIFVPNCISKDCQISRQHQPQNIGKISVLKS